MYTTTYLPSRKLSKLDEPYMQDTPGEAGMSSQVIYSYGPPRMAEEKQDDQLEPTYSSSVMIRDVVLRTYQKRWTIGRSGAGGSGISVLAVRHYDDDIYIYIYIYIYIRANLIFDCFSDFWLNLLFLFLVKTGSYSNYWLKLVNIPNVG